MMHPGFLSVTLYFIAMTLLSTGWWGSLLKRNDIQRRALIAFLTTCFFSGWITIPVAETMNVGGAWGLALGTAVYGWRKTDPEQRPMLFAATVLMTAVCYFIREVAVIDPALLFLPADWLQAGALFLLASTSLKGFWGRVVLVTGGVTSGYTLSLLRHAHELAVMSFGDLALYDLLSVCLFGLTLMESISPVSVGGRWRLLKKTGETNG